MAIRDDELLEKPLIDLEQIGADQSPSDILDAKDIQSIQGNPDIEPSILSSKSEIDLSENNLEVAENETRPQEVLDQEAISAIQGNHSEGEFSDVTHEWVDRGIIDIPVADLPSSEDITDPSDFNHHISWDDAKQGLEMLPEIKNDLNNQKTIDDFRNEDLQNGIQGTGGKEGYYQLFYGNDAVKVDKKDGEYSVINGRHRIAAAKLLNIDTIPARVTEYVELKPMDQ